MKHVFDTEWQAQKKVPEHIFDTEWQAPMNETHTLC